MIGLDISQLKEADNRVLVVDSGKKLGNLIEKGLSGYATIVRAASGDTALHLIALQKIELVITHLRLPLFSGLELATRIKKVRPDLPLLAVTGGEILNDADELYKLGYPPVIHLPEGESDLVQRAGNILIGAQWLSQGKLRIDELKRSFGFDRILSSNQNMRVVYDRLKRVVGSKVAVLIMGESGTGKELVARMIHATSERSKRPFITVNCAAVPEGLLESQFFGHERGAFTGAAQRVAGKFELAHGGTLFLDEIGEMTPSLQAKLLRVIEYGEFERVGGSETLKVDVRLITATNRNLEAMIENGLFRKDLYYRINVFPIELPPLRQRGDDVILLAYHFLYGAAQRNKRQVRAIHPDSLEMLQRYPWPGNIRELENAVERALLLCDGYELKPADFPSQQDWCEAEQEAAGENLPELADNGELPDDQEDGTIKTLAELERDAVRQALGVTHGNVALAARRLGIARGTLYKKLEEFGIKQTD